MQNARETDLQDATFLPDYLREKCGQNYNQVANGLIVWNQPQLSLSQSAPIPGFKL